MQHVGRPGRLIAGATGVAAVAFGVAAAALATGRRHRALVAELHARREMTDAMRPPKSDATMWRSKGDATMWRPKSDATMWRSNSDAPTPRPTSDAAELESGNAQLRETNDRLAAALAFKNDLTSRLTHDVAQPISSIASLAELLRADWDDLPDDIRLELATKIDKNTQRLIKMMNDLQLLFRLDTGSVTARRAPVPLLEVAESVVAASPVAADDVEITVDEGASALADREHLVTVVQNLLINALAYGAPPFRIRGERRGDTIELAVQDSGPGIPEELRPHLFGRFTRGAGLGLFIVRHLVEANGGSVRHEPVSPQGARLVVTLEAAAI